MSDVRISEFIKKLAGEVVADAVFTFVQNGQNFSVTLTELIKILGSGPIEQIGDLTGTPVLKKDGTTNYIRNIIGGPGILTSVSPSDGVQVEQNFTADSTGVPVLTGTGDESPVIRSILAGSGVNVASDGDAIQISVTEAPTSTKTVIVNTVDDFPTPVAGVITLEDDTIYRLTDDVSTPNRFVFGQDSVLVSDDGTIIRLTYTGSDVMFTGNSCSAKLKDVALSCPTAKLFTITCGTGAAIFQMLNCRVVSCDEIGTISGVFTANFENINWEQITTNGVTFSGNIGIINFNANIFNISAGFFCNLGSTDVTGFNFSDSYGLTGTGGRFLSGDTNSGNIATGGLGTVINTRIIGDLAPLQSISERDSLWTFAHNSGMSDSKTFLTVTGENITVPIAAANTPTKIEGTFDEFLLSRFEVIDPPPPPSPPSGNDRFIYTGVGDFVSLSATITADIATGIDDCTFYFAKNGTVITDSGVLREIDSGNPGNLSLLWHLEMETNDYIELYCENNDAAVDITIVKVIFRVD